MIQLATEHDLHPENIERMEIGTYRVALDITDPKSVYDGKFSIQYCTALTAVKRRAGLNEFTEANLYDPVVRSVLKRVYAFEDPTCQANYPDKWGARVTIVTKNGERLEATTDYPKGDFENPVDADELIDKFTSLVRDYLDEPTTSALVERAMSRDALTHVADLFAALTD